MSKIWHIRGGSPLKGTVQVQGSKNSVLPLMAAAALAQNPVTLMGVPQLSDVREMAAILQELGLSVTVEGDTLRISPGDPGTCCIGAARMGALRASVLFLGALLARDGACRMALPGGCDLGPRPIDLHLRMLTAMGAETRVESGCLCAAAPEGLHGAALRLPFPSVGATENVLLAAATAKGRTVLENAAREPEIAALAAFLRKLGVHITGDGTDTVEIIGLGSREALTAAPVTQAVEPDRIAAGTYLCAAAVTDGCITVTGIDPAPLLPLLETLEAAGCTIRAMPGRITLSGSPRSPISVETAPYPGFPTDLQAPLMAAMLRTPGVSRFRDAVFPCRFRHVPALRTVGAEIDTGSDCAAVRGVTALHGATVTATDLRGGAAMVLAALAAEGETILHDAQLLERGYEAMPRILRDLGADMG